MIEVPIVINYDHTRVIGTAQIDETKLPKFMDYCLTLGYRAIDVNINSSEEDIGTLTCLSVQANSAYYQYLRNEYKDVNK